SLLAQASGRLSSLTGIDGTLDRLVVSLTEAQYQVAELSRELHGYLEGVSVDPQRLQEVDERLRAYTDLSRKYGGSTSAAIEFLSKSSDRLAELESTEENLGVLEKARAEQVALGVALAEELTALRAGVAPKLEAAMKDQLVDLGMPEAHILVAIDSHPAWEDLQWDGADNVEFLLAANPGQPARSLARTASGGELSRILLAVKCALAGAGGHETLVFDEVDAGIGGRTAVAVGRKLRELAKSGQLVVITHLARVAALADIHYLIDKTVEADVSITRLRVLEGEEIVRELCRMMGGRPEDTEAMAHARLLRDRAVGGLLD
ncbi:MAG TPA: DNA repair protein RecN, partial [Thermoleophilia bacterium]